MTTSATQQDTTAHTDSHAHDESTCPGCVGGHVERRHEGRRLLLAFAGGILVLNSYIAKTFFADAIDPFGAELSALLGALILALPVFVTAVKDLVKGKLYMNELVALALVAAFASQNYSMAGVVAFFMLITTTIERRTAIGAETAIESLIRLTPSKARRLVKGEEEEVEINELQLDDVVRVRPGENFPADGTVIKGMSTVNQSSITGESLPVDKGENDEVYAGTQNLTGVTDVRVTRVGRDTTLGKVRELIAAAERSRLPVTRLIDLYIKYHTPIVLILAGLVWLVTRDLTRVIAVFVVSCPCALIVAQPSAVVAALAAAARLGILIKDVSLIEVISKLQTLVFDKTGTLTVGDLEVATLSPIDDVSMGELLQSAMSVECHSNHPAAKAMRKLAEEAEVNWEEPEEFQEVTGKGVCGKLHEQTIRVGRLDWLRSEGFDTQKLEDSIKEEDTVGMTHIGVSKGDKLIGWIGLRDATRPGAEEALSDCYAAGINRCCMVTGDNQSVADLVGEKLHLSEIQAECLPEKKVEYVENLRERGYIVGVVGDGVNDAPALSSGEIGIAMGAIGSEVAVESAPIALMNNDLRRVPFLITLARKAKMVTIQNILAAVLVMAGGIYFAMTGVISPILAAVVHSLGTLIVIFNSARLVRSGENLQQQQEQQQQQQMQQNPGQQ